MKIHLEKRHAQIVWNILKKYPYTFYAFGSRAKGTDKRLSDLDLFVNDSMSISILGDIKEDFAESNLPFSVDVVVAEYCSQEFKDQIKKDLVWVTEKTLGIDNE